MKEFVAFQKIARLTRNCVITEKIDGTNACIYIGADGEFLVGSRSRWITPQDDNYGFARWAYDHKDELMLLGEGQHFGEWWGCGIQRKYNLTEKKFSLFNTARWCLHGEEPKVMPTQDPRITRTQDILPACCGLVPVLYSGIFDTGAVDDCITLLKMHGSQASKGFMNPEGVVIYHELSRCYFKKTIEKDEEPKGKTPCQNVN